MTKLTKKQREDIARLPPELRKRNWKKQTFEERFDEVVDLYRFGKLTGAPLLDALEELQGMYKKPTKCDHIVAFHVGHSEIRASEATPENLSETCCGGVMKLNYCPDCGQKLDKVMKV